MTEGMFHPAAANEKVQQARLEDAIDRMTASIRAETRIRHICTAYLPHRSAVIQILEWLTWLMFPGFFGPRELSDSSLREHVADVASKAHHALAEQISRALRYERHVENDSGAFDQQCAECDARAAEAAVVYVSRLPELRRLLSLDVQAAFDGDPAARHTDETIFSYPGILALTTQRLAHELYRLSVPLLPRMMSEFAHSRTGIDIHPGARIGASFFIDHGTGVVIGETTIIGDHCKIYQGVTLGAASFPKDERGRLVRGVKRHPTLEDHVTIYAGATILGGETVIGAGSVVNGGVFLTQSVPPGHIVRGPKAEIKLRANPDLPPTNYHI